MTSFSPEPEFWVEDASEDWAGEDWGGGDDGVPPGGPPGSEQPPRGPRRWPRWVALAAGLAVIAGLIAWQSRTGNVPEVSEQTSNQTPPALTPLTGDTGTAEQTSAPGQTTERRTTVTQSGTSSSTPSSRTTLGDDPNDWLPATTEAPAVGLTDPALLDDATWELVGLRWPGALFVDPVTLVRYRPATGELITTPVPPPSSAEPLDLVLTSDAAIIHPMSSDGYLVRDGAAAEPLSGLLADSPVVLPGPDPEHVWALQGDASAPGAQTDTTAGSYTVHPPEPAPQSQFALVDLDGAPTGTVIDVPDTDGGDPSYRVSADGAGFAQFSGVGGVYRLQADGTHLITHGQVLATGPTTLLLNECDDQARCQSVLLDRKSGERRTVPGLTPPTSYGPGFVSPDGRRAVMVDAQSSSLILVDLESGTTTVLYPSQGRGQGQALPTGVFTPDSRYLLLAGQSQVEAIEATSGQSLGTLPVPPLVALAVRPLG